MLSAGCLTNGETAQGKNLQPKALEIPFFSLLHRLKMLISLLSLPPCIQLLPKSTGLLSKTLFQNKKTKIFNRSLVLKFGVLVFFSDHLFVQWGCNRQLLPALVLL